MTSAPDAADRAVALRLACASFLVFALLTHGHFTGGDEVAVYETTKSIFERGSLAIPKMSFAFRGTDRRFYSQYAVGQSLLALPFYAVGRLAAETLPERARRVLAGPQSVQGPRQFAGSVEIFAVMLYSPLASALLVALFFLFERDLGASRATALGCAALVGATTYVALMSTYFLRHATEGVTILGGFLFLHRFAAGGALRNLWIGSALASTTLLVRFPAGVAGLALGGYAIWCLHAQRERISAGPGLGRALAALLVPALAAVAVAGAFDQAKWGAPVNWQLATAGGRFSTPLYLSLHGYLLSPGNSVFVYSPLLCLAPWSVPLLWRRQRALCAAFLALAVSFLLVFGSWHQWTGLWSSPGPRYLFAPTVLLLLSLGPWLAARPGTARRAAVAALALLGAGVQLAFAAASWPAVVTAMGALEDSLGFLFVPSQSPLLGALRVLRDGRFVDLWLWGVAFGRPGIAPAPLAALAILAVWSLAFGGCVASLRRVLRAAAAEAGSPDRRNG